MVFAPKYQGKVIYHELKRDVGQILRKLCHERKVEMIEAEACPDHVDMLVNIPAYMGIVQFVGTLKSKSALMLPIWNTRIAVEVFGAEATVDTVGKNEKMIKFYVQNQLEEFASDQLTRKEFKDPFIGDKRKQATKGGHF